MAQSGYTPILIYASSTASAAPTAGNLTSSANGAELALNYTDGKLYYKDNVGAVQLLASKAGASGSVTSVDVSGGTTGLTTSGGPVTTSGTITLAGTLVVANGGTGATTLTANNVILGNGTSAVQFVAPGSNGNVLTSNGTTWTSTAPTSTSTLTISNKTGAYTVVSGDAGTVINCTSGTFTVSLTAAASLGSGFNVTIWNTGTGTITIDPNGAETIDGVATLTLRQGEGTQIVCDGTNWQTGNKKTMRGYAENAASTNTRPVASGISAIAIGSSVTASGIECLAIGYNNTASGPYTAALGRSVTASGTGATALGYQASATSNYSNSLGANSSGQGSQAVTGAGATAIGGSYASGTDSFAAGIADNTSSYGATGTNSVAIGKLAKATGTQGLALGANATSTANGAVAISSNNSGDATTASGLYSIAIGSSFVLASGAGSVALSHGRAAEDGKYAFGWAYFSNANATECQTGTMVLKAATTSATPVVFSSNASGAGGNNQVILPDNSAFAFSALIVARRQASGGTQSAAWKIEGLIRREGSAATTTLVNSATTVLDNTPGWTIAVSADTTNGGLAITATGAASTNIRWVATVQTSEVTYA